MRPLTLPRQRGRRKPGVFIVGQARHLESEITRDGLGIEIGLLQRRFLGQLAAAFPSSRGISAAAGFPAAAPPAEGSGCGAAAPGGQGPVPESVAVALPKRTARDVAQRPSNPTTRTARATAGRRRSVIKHSGEEGKRPVCRQAFHTVTLTNRIAEASPPSHRTLGRISCLAVPKRRLEHVASTGPAGVTQHLAET